MDAHLGPIQWNIAIYDHKIFIIIETTFKKSLKNNE